MKQKIRKSPEQMRKKYNTAYRLRKKIGKERFPRYGKVIYSDNPEEDEKLTTVITLISEFGFIIKPSFFAL